MFQYSRPRRSTNTFSSIVERATADSANELGWTVPELRRHVRGAIALEFFTIPPYLTALYSIHGTSEQATAASSMIRSVVVEEMLHMELACNVSSALGVAVDLPAAVPTYPAPIPFHTPDLVVGLAGATREQLGAFMQVELPTGDDPNGPAQHDCRPKPYYDTIGEFYSALVYGLVVLETRAAVSGSSLFLGPRGIQQTAFANHFEWVHDLGTAIAALEVIVAEGEGATLDDPDVPIDEAMQSDREISHYARFEYVRDNDHLGPGDVYDIDPGQGTLRGRLRALDDVFNAAYSLVINELQAAFSNRSDRLGAGIDNMLGFVQTTAKLMMAAQITPDGPHARPTFAYDASVSTRHDLDGYLRALDEADRRVLERNGVVLPA